MDLNRTPSQISNAAAEEIRALNHRTLDAKVFETPADVAYTADGIAALIQRLPQALQQLEAGLRALDENNGIRLADRHPSEVSQQDIAHAVADALLGLEAARSSISTAEGHLRDATSVLGNLGAPWPEDGDDEH
ncbi:hypothetical protein [Streptomyces misionensis]|uniref:hypothetical protein n=1 Tax=Streptomyces misionensis TaxID=67331 RepID=UPI00367AB87C